MSSYVVYWAGCFANTDNVTRGKGDGAESRSTLTKEDSLSVLSAARRSVSRSIMSVIMRWRTAGVVEDGQSTSQSQSISKEPVKSGDREEGRYEVCGVCVVCEQLGVNDGQAGGSATSFDCHWASCCSRSAPSLSPQFVIRPFYV